MTIDKQTVSMSKIALTVKRVSVSVERRRKHF